MLNGFHFQFQKRRPLWKDLLYFFTTFFSIWALVHLFLNFDAYAQMAQFRYHKLEAMVFAPSVRAEKLTLSPADEAVKRGTLSFHPQRNSAKEIFAKMDVYPSDNRIYIPRIQKNIPLVSVPLHQNWNQLEKNIQKGLQNGVVVHPISHEPGQLGNFFVTGHSSYYKWDPGKFKDIFALLHEVNVGDIVEVYWEGKKYTYEMKTKDVVLPTATQVLNQPENLSIISLMTCTPVGTNKNRLVLVGELVSSS